MRKTNRQELESETSQKIRSQTAKSLESGDPYGIRTRVAAVKGRCPRPLDEGVAVEAAQRGARREPGIYKGSAPGSSRHFTKIT